MHLSRCTGNVPDRDRELGIVLVLTKGQDQVVKVLHVLSFNADINYFQSK